MDNEIKSRPNFVFGMREDRIKEIESRRYAEQVKAAKKAEKKKVAKTEPKKEVVPVTENIEENK